MLGVWRTSFERDVEEHAPMSIPSDIMSVDGSRGLTSCSIV